MKKFLLLFLLIFIYNKTFAIYFKNISIQDGITQLSVLSIHQDILGRMWFGTEEGINIYDGIHTISYKPTSNTYSDKFATGNKVTYITDDIHGNVFFIADYSLYKYDIYREQSYCIIKNNVNTIYSYKGEIWVGIKNGIYILDNNDKLKPLCYLDKSVLRSTTIRKDKSGNTWIGTNKGLYIRESRNKIKLLIPNISISDVFIDSGGNIWISTDANGLYLYTAKKKLLYFDEHKNPSDEYKGYIASNQVRNITEDNFGNIWIGTFQGLNKYIPKKNIFITYKHTDVPGSLSHSSVFPVYKDKQGSIWIGTYYGGVNYFNPEIDIFNYYTVTQEKKKSISYPFVGHMIEDKYSNIWICTEGGGLNMFDRKSKEFTHYYSSNQPNSIAHNNLKCITYDKENDILYIGTHTGGLSIMNLKSRTIINPMLTNHQYKSEVGDRISNMVLHNNELVFTTQNGIWKMNTHTYIIEPYFKSGNHYGYSIFHFDNKNYIWLSSNSGIYKINIDNEKDINLFKYGENGLGLLPIISMLEDNDGTLYFGSNGSGLYRYNEKENNFTGFSTQNSNICGNYCYDMIKLKQDEILISSDNGLSFFNTKTYKFNVIESSTFMPTTKINAGCGILVSKDGEIFVGLVNGFITFYEQQLKVQEKRFQLFFSELLINNKFVHPTDGSKILKKAIYFTDKVTLSHKQNDISVHFTSNNYVVPFQHPTYEYKLEGYDDNWIETNSHSIHYTNINPGNYTLLVRQKGPSFKDSCIKLDIEIEPPFYATPIFYFLYIITTLGTLYSIFRFKQSQFILKTSLEMEKKEKNRIEEVNQAKLQFFANISHEFRTPLTIIISQLEMMMQEKRLTNIYKKQLMKVYRNAFQMKNLISELLDFRKLEQGYVKIEVSQMNIINFLQNIYISFSDFASIHSINYKFNTTSTSIMCWFDAKQLKKVFYNLLSNSFKYTKENGTIEIVVTDNEKNVVIKIIDNGIGIKKDDLDKIFERYYQAKNTVNEISNVQSSGIGLSLAKSITELHHGTINVESSPGYGTIFTITLNKGKELYTENEIKKDDLLINEADIKEIPLINEENYFTLQHPIIDENLETKDEKKDKTILLVEDNSELLSILVALFSPIYKVIQAENGKEGLEKAEQEIPDIIVSDVMMPKMNGYEMCRYLKNKFETCHIPIILLTALSSEEQNIEGLKLGADDYLTKPFNPRILLVKCNNFINNRSILQKKFKNEECDYKILATNTLDENFLTEVNEVIDNNIDNSDFVIDELAKKMGMSRTAFYQKFKVLTGMTPKDYVLNIKLKKAAAYLRNNPEMQVSDITYKLGFSSPRYFSRFFKAQFNLAPSDYAKQYVKKDYKIG